MIERVFIFVNGILNRPGDAHGWTDRACEWVNGRTDYKGEKFKYFAGVFTRRLLQNKHANDLAEKIRTFGAYNNKLVLVGHSNGCDLLLRALQKLDRRYELPFIDCLHLISGACERDFDRNGLNALVEVRLIKEVRVYVAGQDSHFCHPMWFARLSQRLIGWCHLGYGTLGAHGPANVTGRASMHVTTITEHRYDHSTWFQPKPFEELMSFITRPAP